MSRDVSFLYFRIEMMGFGICVGEFKDYVFYGGDGVFDLEVLLNVEN